MVYTPEIRSIKINNMVLPGEDGGQNHSAFTAEEEREKVDIINMINDLDIKRRTDDLEDIGGDSPDITIDCYNQKEEKTYSIYFYGDIVTCEGGGIFSAGTYKIGEAEYDKIHELCCEYEGMSYKLDRNIDDLLNQFGVRKYKQVADNYYCFYSSYE